MSEYVENNCYKCAHHSTVPGNCHIRCEKPDPTMKGDAQGLAKGWFYYPVLFDPVWMDSKCANFAVPKADEVQE